MRARFSVAIAAVQHRCSSAFSCDRICISRFLGAGDRLLLKLATLPRLLLIHTYRDHEVVLSVENEVKLADLSKIMEKENIDFVLHREQPEKILTAIALRPYAKKKFPSYLNGFPVTG